MYLRSNSMTPMVHELPQVVKGYITGSPEFSSMRRPKIVSSLVAIPLSYSHTTVAPR